MERMDLSHGFGPFYRPSSKILILGSFPSARSREQGFYYGHPQNRFWKLMAFLLKDDIPLSVEDKILFCERHFIALYDVIESCSILGSSDSSIRNAVPADILPILSGTDVGCDIFTNGGKARELYKRHILPRVGVDARALPSTSPRNAACSFEKLVRVWGGAVLPALSGK